MFFKVSMACRSPLVTYYFKEKFWVSHASASHLRDVCFKSVPKTSSNKLHLRFYLAQIVHKNGKILFPWRKNCLSLSVSIYAGDKLHAQLSAKMCNIHADPKHRTRSGKTGFDPRLHECETVKIDLLPSALKPLSQWSQIDCIVVKTCRCFLCFLKRRRSQIRITFCRLCLP